MEAFLIGFFMCGLVFIVVEMRSSREIRAKLIASNSELVRALRELQESQKRVNDARKRYEVVNIRNIGSTGADCVMRAHSTNGLP